VSTKCGVDTIIRCLVIALLLLIRYVNVWPWPLTFWPWSVVIHGGSRVQPLHQVWRSYGYPILSYKFWHLPQNTLPMHLQPLRMRRIMWPMRRGQIFPHIFEIPDPDLPLHYTTFIALRLRQMELSAKTMYGLVVRITQLSAHAENHVSIERCRKPFTTIVLANTISRSSLQTLAIWQYLGQFLANIFTAHAQKRLFMNFRLKFWHHHSIPWPRLPYKVRYFRDLRMFSVDFCIG